MSRGTRETTEQRAERLDALAHSGRAISPQDYKRKSRRSFVTGAVGVAAAAFGWRGVQTQPTDRAIPRVLRAGYDFNAALWRRIPATPATAPELPRSAAEDLRVNGTVGLDNEIDFSTWTFQVLGPGGEQLDELVLDDITRMGEHVNMTTLHKCDEGWSDVANWTGIRFSDFADRYADDVQSAAFVSMKTPDEQYYIGLERESMLNPQTLLAFELNGQPLSQDHGGPLRLYTPNHYGVKSLKRIGTIQFTNTRPADYWAERGYDWYDRL